MEEADWSPLLLASKVGRPLCNSQGRQMCCGLRFKMAAAVGVAQPLKLPDDSTSYQGAVQDCALQLLELAKETETLVTLELTQQMVNEVGHGPLWRCARCLNVPCRSQMNRCDYESRAVPSARAGNLQMHFLYRRDGFGPNMDQVDLVPSASAARLMRERSQVSTVDGGSGVGGAASSALEGGDVSCSSHSSEGAASKTKRHGEGAQSTSDVSSESEAIDPTPKQLSWSGKAALLSGSLPTHEPWCVLQRASAHHATERRV